jgi:hypothetical protein
MPAYSLFPRLSRLSGPSRRAAAFIALSAILGLAFWNYVPPGAFHDDAIYWLLSQSLRQGRYILPSDPGEPVMVNYMPGYPLFLAVTAWMDGYGLARFWSWLCFVGSAVLAWKIARRLLGTGPGLWVLAWFAVQPLRVRYSAAVLSEPLFTFLVLASFWIYGKDGKRPGWSWLLCLLAGWSALVRPTGFLLGAALGADAALRKKFRLALGLLSAVILVQGGYSWAIQAATQEPSSFLGQWRFAVQGSPSGAIQEILRANARQYADLLGLLVAFPLGQWSRFLDSVPVAAESGTLAVAGCALWGWILMLRGPARSLGLFAAFQGLVLLFWLRPDPRYLDPLIFPFLLCLWTGLRGIGKKQDVPWKKAVVAAGVFLGLAMNVRGLWSPSLPMPESAFQGIRRLGADAVLASEISATVYLHTGRRGTGYPRIFDPDAMLDFLLERGVSHALVDEQARMPRPDPNDWNPVVRLVVSQPGRFARLDHFAQDGFSLYEIRVDTAAFRAAARFYRDGLKALEARDAARAEALFQSALRARPDMTSAHDRLAHLAFQRGDRREAKRRLEKSLRIWPGNPFARYHLFLVRRSLGEPGVSEDLEQARHLARQHGVWPLLWEMERQTAP